MAAMEEVTLSDLSQSVTAETKRATCFCSLDTTALSAFNKTGTSKVGAISKAQKAQKTFFEKKLEFFDFFSFRKCRIVPKNVKGGGPFGLS